MAGITQAQAQARLDAWLEADAKVAEGQAWSIAGRSLTRADAAQIRENITYWQAQVAKLSTGRAGGARIRYGVVDR